MNDRLRLPVVCRVAVGLLGIVVTACIAGHCTARQPAAEPADVQLRVVQESPNVTVFRGDSPVLAYRYTDVPFKPCVQKLYSPSGVQILRDSPHDPVHHHALMFAVAADGVDFWSENAACGKQVHVSIGELKTDVQDRFGTAQFTQTLHWKAPGGEGPTLIEKRTISALALPNVDETIVSWQSEFTSGTGRDVKLSGSHYFGLGMRFVQSMDKGGKFQYESTDAGVGIRGTERVTPSSWCAYSATADGKPVTVALLDAASNPRSPAPMFTMQDHFAYLSATLNLYKEPITLPAGEKLTLRYGVVVCDGTADGEKMKRLHDLYTGP